MFSTEGTNLHPRLEGTAEYLYNGTANGTTLYATDVLGTIIWYTQAQAGLIW